MPAFACDFNHPPTQVTRIQSLYEKSYKEPLIRYGVNNLIIIFSYNSHTDNIKGNIKSIIQDGKQLFPSLGDSEHILISNRVSTLIQELSINKSFAAAVLHVSRTTIYDWLDNKTTNFRSDTESRIQWLENFAQYLPHDIKQRLNIYRNRMIHEGRTLENLLVQAEYDPSDVARMLISSIDDKNRIPFGAWKQGKSKGSIPDIYEAISDEG